MSRSDIGLLPPLGPSAQQDHKLRSIPTEINAVSGTEIQPQFLNARAYALRCRNTATFQSIKCNGNPGLGYIIQLVKPPLKRIAPLTVNVLANLDHIRMVA